MSGREKGEMRGRNFSWSAVDTFFFLIIFLVFLLALLLFVFDILCSSCYGKR